MKTRELSDGAFITELGFGAAQLGNLNRSINDEEARAAVDAAWDEGIRYFDTAPHYGLGLSESRLGKALRSRPRAEYMISTKVGRLLTPTPERARRGLIDEEGFVVPADHRRVWDFSRDGVLRSIDSSLERLGLDHIDIAFLHDPDDHWDAASSTGIGALRELRDQGVVGAVGAAMNQSAMLARFIAESDVDVVLVAGRYSLLDRTAEADLLPAAEQRGVSVIAAGVYNSGLLSRHVVPDDARFDYSVAPGGVIDRARELARVCSDQGVEMPDAAVQFPLRHPAVSSVLIGMRDAAAVRSSVDRYERGIHENAWRALDAAP